MERHVITPAQRWLRPELYARITEKLVFQRLSYDVQVEIAYIMLKQQLAFLASRGHPLTVTPEVLPFLIRKGFHPRLGARPLRDVIEKLIGDAVTSQLMDAGTCLGRLCLAKEQLKVEPHFH